MTAKKKKTAAKSPLDSYWDIGKLIVPGSSKRPRRQGAKDANKVEEANKVLNTVPFDPGYCTCSDLQDAFPVTSLPVRINTIAGAVDELEQIVNALEESLKPVTRGSPQTPVDNVQPPPGNSCQLNSQLFELESRIRVAIGRLEFLDDQLDL